MQKPVVADDRLLHLIQPQFVDSLPLCYYSCIIILFHQQYHYQRNVSLLYPLENRMVQYFQRKLFTTLKNIL